MMILRSWRTRVDFVLDVLANDLITPDTGETLKITGFAGLSAGGSLTINAAQDRLLYTPAANFFGTETFTYTISDGNGGTDQATVTITVMEANDPPVATNDVFAAVEDSFDVDNVIFVLANDSTAGDPDETLLIVDVSTPDQGGTVTIATDKRSLLYAPATNFFGTERFTYQITDGNGGLAEATVTVTVQATNDPPTAVNDSASVVKGSSGNMLDVLANDSSAPDPTEELKVISAWRHRSARRYRSRRTASASSTRRLLTSPAKTRSLTRSKIRTRPRPPRPSR